MTPKKMLTRAGLRSTAHRLAVLAMLLEARDALTPAELLRGLAGSLNRVTLYRILDTLTQKGIVHRHNAGERAFRYCLEQFHATSGHGHFHCSRCGRVTCLPPQALDTERLSRALSCRIERADIVLDGTCAACLGRQG